MEIFFPLIPVNTHLSSQDAERIDSLSSINAAYILDKLPQRKYNYGDTGGHFEVSVRLLISAPRGKRIGLIGMSYQEDHKTETHVETYILHENGEVYAFDPEIGKIQQTIRLAHLYMLLNPTDVGGWQLHQPSGNAHREVGLSGEEDHTVHHSRYLLLQMERVQGSVESIL